MKYTVVIRQPVPVEQRPLLEQQLVERFKLTPDQAHKLAARNPGRLMKPTGRPRAELLVSVYESLGLKAILEEVPEQTGIFSEPFAAPAAAVPPMPALTPMPTPAPATDDDTLLAPQSSSFRPPSSGPDLGVPSSELKEPVPLPEHKTPTLLEGLLRQSSPNTDPFSSVVDESALAQLPTWDDVPTAPSQPEPERDPFSSGVFRDPFATAIIEPPRLDKAAPASAPQPSVPTPAASSPEVTVVSPVVPPITRAEPVATLAPAPSQAVPPLPEGDMDFASFSSALAAEDNSKAAKPAASVPSAADTSDVWSDFTGSLAVAEEQSPAVTQQPAQVVIAAPIPEELPTTTPAKKRESLSQRLSSTSLLPLLILTLATLLSLLLTLPNMQQRLLRENTQSLASTLGANFTTGNQEQIGRQLDALVAAPSIDLARIETNNGKSFTRAGNPAQDATINKQLAEWAKKGETTGKVKLNGTTYAVSRMSYVKDGKGGLRAVEPSAEKGLPLVHRLTVGVPVNHTNDDLLKTMLIILGISLLALALSAWMVMNATRRLIQPIEHLVKVADSISMGDLSQPVRAERNDEIGDLAEALERMRISLESAMSRLRRRKRG